MNLIVQPVEKDMARSNNCEVEMKERAIKKCKLIADLRNEDLFNSWQEKMSLQDQTVIHSLHFSDAKWSQIIKRKINPWAIQNELHPRNWKQTLYHKIKQGV